MNKETDVSGCEYYIDSVCYFKRLQTKNAKLKEEIFNWEQINKLQEKYKQALEEIREMTIYDYVQKCNDNSENCTIENCLEKRIQRKINEVLKDE